MAATLFQPQCAEPAKYGCFLIWLYFRVIGEEGILLEHLLSMG